MKFEVNFILNLMICIAKSEKSLNLSSAAQQQGVKATQAILA